VKDVSSIGHGSLRHQGLLKEPFRPRTLIPVRESRYRWAVLAAGVFAQAALSAVQQGLPAIAPVLRDELHLSLEQVGVVLASVSWGITALLLVWGWLADRAGERLVVSVGLAGGALALVAGAFTTTYGALVAALALTGALAGCTSVASGRAVMAWFGRHQRGLALGVRQMAVPLGGVAGALALPALAAAGGIKAALLALAAGCAVGALACGTVFREPRAPSEPASGAPAPLRDARMWRLSAGSFLYVTAQISIVSFAVLFLHDARGVAAGAAAAVLAAIQLGGAASRALAGWASDRAGARMPLMRDIGLVTAVALLATAALARGPLVALVPALLAAGVVSMSWNGLSVTAAAELSGPGRTGAAIGLQQTAVGLAAGTGVGFAALVGATSWPLAFALLAVPPLAGSLLLRPLVRTEGSAA
jgi:sugar phosphate permease